INVPVSDWLSKMDPELAKEFGDFITVRKGGLSKEDIDFVKDSADQQRIPVLETGHGPTDAIRAAIHAEPLFDAERMQKLKLERSEVEDDRFQHVFNLTDSQGNGVGRVNINETEGGKHLDVGWVGKKSDITSKDEMLAG